jgi:hypothetical protein
VGITTKHRPRATVFGHQLIAVVQKLGDARAAARCLKKPPERVKTSVAVFAPVAETRRFSAS